MTMKEIEILEVMERDARLTPEKIATMLGLDEKDVAESIAQFKASGAIVKYKTVVNWEKVNEAANRVSAIIEVKVTPIRDRGFEVVADRISRFPEVRALYLMSGAYDLQVEVEGEGMKEVAFFVAEKLATIDGVLSTATHFVLKKYKEDYDTLIEESRDKRLAITP